MVKKHRKKLKEDEISRFGTKKKSTRETKLILKMAKNKDEKIIRSYMLQSFHKQYQFF